MDQGLSLISAGFQCTMGAFSLDVSFDAPGQGVTVLFGASGSGKTTVLRCIAGLCRAKGWLRVGEDIWQDDGSRRFLRPHQRPIGFVFQDARLFPHLSVCEDLLFGARRATRTSSSGLRGFDEVVDLLNIGHLLDRKPDRLSGGERQRVALGRALLSRPRILLMDEPLAALDSTNKEEILPYFESLRENLAIPMVYVTHDIAEADRLADMLVLVDQGRVVATGPLAELEANLGLPLLQLPDAAVTLDASVAGVDPYYSLTRFTVPGGVLTVPGQHGPEGSIRRLRIGVSDVSFSLERPVSTTMLNCLPARIIALAPRTHDDARIHVVVQLGEDGSGAQIAGRITRKSCDALALRPGLNLYALVKSVALTASTDAGKKSIATDTGPYL